MDNRDALLCFFEAENKRNWTDYIKFLDPDVQWILHSDKKEQTITGRESYMDKIKSAYDGNDDSFSCEAIYSDGSGNRLAVILINNHGKRSNDIFEFENGLIRKEWEFLL